ncbi:hypothetical protein TUMEXPCC7403_13725 [Tumidithrix helvetica PCC 7403]|uniref:(2Fe-2S) ferredoxin domain-containing protein n=1 Tax=Tumidithrix helvetica TaxID=3457545 RepID=UPI003C9F688C
MTKNCHITPFRLEGKFLGLVWKGRKLKCLRMTVGEDELEIALSKQARSLLSMSINTKGKPLLSPWDRIQVLGNEKCDRQTGELQRKIYDVLCCGESHCESILVTSLATSESQSFQPTKPQTKLLVCQKSGCKKKGGRKQHQAIESALRDRQLYDLVSIEETGCLGRCSMAPNVVLMPGKHRLSGMPPQAIADLIEARESK